MIIAKTQNMLTICFFADFGVNSQLVLMVLLCSLCSTIGNTMWRASLLFAQSKVKLWATEKTVDEKLSYH